MRFAVLRTRFTTWVLDTDALKRELGEDDYTRFCRV